MRVDRGHVDVRAGIADVHADPGRPRAAEAPAVTSAINAWSYSTTSWSTPAVRFEVARQGERAGAEMQCPQRFCGRRGQV